MATPVPATSVPTTSAGQTGAPATSPGVQTPAQPMQDPSIVDFLNSNGIPTDKNTRAQIYSSMGLGSTDEYLAGIGTGATNTALLQALRAAPGTVSAIAKGIKAGQAVSSLNLSDNGAPASSQQATGGTTGSNPMEYNPNPTGPNAAPAQTPEQIAAAEAAAASGGSTSTSGTTPPNTLPGDTSGSSSAINDFQQKFLDQYKTNEAAANTEAAAFSAATVPLTPDQILAQAQDVQNKTGFTADQQKYSALVASYDSTKSQIITEMHNTGGVVTQSQLDEMVASRNQPLQAQISALATDMATKKSLVDLVMQQAQTSRQDAATKAAQLMSLYNGNAQAALDHAATFYNTQVQVNAQQMSDKIATGLKYGLNLTPDQLLNLSYAQVAAMAIPKAQTISELTVATQQLQQATIQEKLQALSDNNAGNSALAYSIMGTAQSDPASAAAMYYSAPATSQPMIKGILASLGMNLGTLTMNNPAYTSQVKTVSTANGNSYNYLDLTNIPSADAPAALSYAAANGIPAINKTDVAKLQAITTAQKNLQSIASSVKSFLPTTWYGRLLGGMEGNTVAQSLQSSSQIAAFNSWRTAVINNVQALAGGSGSGLRINQAEIDAAMTNDLPKITDTLGTANSKIANLNSQMDQWVNTLTQGAVPAKVNLQDPKTGAIRTIGGLTQAQLTTMENAGYKVVNVP